MTSHFLLRPGVLSTHHLAIMLDISQKVSYEHGMRFAYGGSIALNATGIYNKPVGDFDIVIPETQSITQLIGKIGFIRTDEAEINENEPQAYESYLNEDGEQVTRVSGHLVSPLSPSVKIPCCIFQRPTKDKDGFIYECARMRFFDSTIQILNINETVYAKVRYADQSSNPEVKRKHLRDCDHISRELGKLLKETDIVKAKAKPADDDKPF